MNSLHTSLAKLLAKLENKQVLTKSSANIEKFKVEELARYIRDLFVEEYPEIEIRRLLEKVHYANTYEDKVLKEIAFLANRDFVVGYFNTLIIDPNIEPTEYNFVLMEVDSLIENSFVEVPEEE